MPPQKKFIINFYFSNWQVNADIDGGKATFQTQEGGVYVAVKSNNVGVIIGSVFGVLIVIGIVIGAAFFYFRKNPDKLSGLKRSFQSKV